MRIVRRLRLSRPPHEVFTYLRDFTHTEEWDPGTVSTSLVSGDGGVGSRYHNVSTFLRRRTELEYVVVTDDAPSRLRLRGENATVTTEDTMSLAPDGDGTELTYEAVFTFKGWARWLAPLTAPVFRRLGDEAEKNLRRVLG